MDLVLNNLQRLICNKTQTTNQKIPVQVRAIQTKQNSKCSLCEDRDETFNYISEYRKLTQNESKIENDLVGKVIHLELSKKLNFDHTIKWYMPKPEFAKENGT